jgi:hypothetical protein
MANKNGKKKDPEAPYSDNPTPGKPGWNLARGTRGVRKTRGTKSNKGGKGTVDQNAFKTHWS